MHIHKRFRVPETTEEDIASMDFEHICAECERDFPSKRGLAIHIGRWCDGGKNYSVYERFTDRQEGATPHNLIYNDDQSFIMLLMNLRFHTRCKKGH